MKDFYFVRLFDVYAELLTQRQREICELYYLCDLSLTEIAQQKQSSKQSVSDTLAKSRAALEGYEQKPQCLQKEERYERLRAGVERLRADYPECAADADALLRED